MPGILMLVSAQIMLFGGAFRRALAVISKVPRALRS